MMDSTYDFIVVGGGTAGLVIANRLTEDPNIQVLVLEAGQNHNDDPRVKTPASYPELYGSEVHWTFQSEPQAALNGRRIIVPQGKALGGSSAVNFLLFVPPSKSLVDTWEKLGNDGWNWNTMKPYFAKAHSRMKLEPELKNHLGIDWNDEPALFGPVQTTYNGDLESPIPKIWDETFKNLGCKMNGEPFSGASMGSFSTISSINPATAERSSSATAYYDPVSGRKNLCVLTGCTVEKIIFEIQKPAIQATGVQFRREGKTVIANVSREVIVAAGAIQSPKVLELSGVGDAAILKSHHIDVLMDNPNVGENLQDHPISAVIWEAKHGIRTRDDLFRRNPEAVAAALAEYTTNKTGPLTSTGCGSFAFLPVFEFFTQEGQATLKGLINDHAPQSQGTPASQAYYDIAKSFLESKDEASAAYFALDYQARHVTGDSPEPGRFISIPLYLTYPLSRGSVHISSSDPLEAPIVDPKYLSHPLDMEVFARHILYTQTIAASEPFRSSLLLENGRTVPEGGFSDLNAAKDYLRERVVSMCHPTSTCAMLPKDMGGVIDARLVVYGTRNVRVVDSSIMPLISTGNTQSMVYAVAERAADLIKKDHGLV